MRADGKILHGYVTASLKEKTTSPEARARVRLAHAAHLPIRRAVDMAEATIGGRVFDVLEQANGKPLYEMQVIAGTDVEDVVVNPATGGVNLLG